MQYTGERIVPDHAGVEGQGRRMSVAAQVENEKGRVLMVKINLFTHIAIDLR